MRKLPAATTSISGSFSESSASSCQFVVIGCFFSQFGEEDEVGDHIAQRFIGIEMTFAACRHIILVISRHCNPIGIDVRRAGKPQILQGPQCLRGTGMRAILVPGDQAAGYYVVSIILTRTFVGQRFFRVDRFQAFDYPLRSSQVPHRYRRTDDQNPGSFNFFQDLRPLTANADLIFCHDLI
jgi:hypothetical protein